MSTKIMFSKSHLPIFELIAICPRSLPHILLIQSDMSFCFMGILPTIFSMDNDAGFSTTYPIGSMYAIYGNIYHQYTPFMLAYIPAPWIRHGIWIQTANLGQKFCRGIWSPISWFPPASTIDCRWEIHIFHEASFAFAYCTPFAKLFRTSPGHSPAGAAGVAATSPAPPSPKSKAVGGSWSAFGVV